MRVMLISMVWIFLAMGAYGAVHSWLASRQAKMLFRRIFGSRIDRYYRLMYNGFAIISLLPVLALPALLPDRRLWSIPYPWTLISLGLQVGAGLVLLIGVLQTGAGEFLGLRQLFRDTGGGPLVVGGLYRRVRHPLYTAGLVFIWLAPLMTANLLFLNIGLTTYLVIGARLEERKLLGEFGEAYREYLRRTPMFIPKLF